MSYLESNDIKQVLSDIASRKEFITGNSLPDTKLKIHGFIPGSAQLIMPGLKLNGAQLFIKNFQNPNTNNSRILIKWQTGVGKSIAAISIAQEFIRQFRIQSNMGISTPRVFIISFTSRETIQEDLFKYPEFGIVSVTEAAELQQMRISASNQTENKKLSSFIGILRRRMTDIKRGGFYQFYGYKEFANNLFVVTLQGESNDFNVQVLYKKHKDNFIEKINEAVESGDLKINTILMNNMKDGLLICDEIHNTYNITESNNYGIAIKYVLDMLGKNAPRSIFMSATPITGSATEIIDLLNLLNPVEKGIKQLQREDFFIKNERMTGCDYYTTEMRLRDGALEKIAALSAGKVSFLLDSDVDAYPVREFIGESIANIPYLKLTRCDMSKYHDYTIHKQCGCIETNISLAANSYTLYDMVYPNPDKRMDTGLYMSTDAPFILKNAPIEWKQENGIIIESGVEYGLPPEIPIITGPFLKLENLVKYSTKYTKLMEETLNVIKSGPGKIMIYHHRVLMSGIITIQEVLKMNGLVELNGTPNNSTICSVCGICMKNHDNSAHTFLPARFIMAHSNLEKAAMYRSIQKFNALSNLQGHEIRVIVGSKIIREGLNFTAIRHQFIASLPTDYPTLIQVIGRVVRKNSHAALPPQDRNVKIRIFVSTRSDGQDSVEMRKYIYKGNEYLQIQKIEQALHINAIDNFANNERIVAALSDADGSMGPTINALPYTPVKLDKSELKTSTFLAYGYSQNEINAISVICRILFNARPVWTYDDLWAAVKSNQVYGMNYLSENFDEGNFGIALERLKISGISLTNKLYQTPKYYISSPYKIDIQSYLPLNNVNDNRITVNVSKHIDKNLVMSKWEGIISEFNKKFMVNLSLLDMSLIEYTDEFHYQLIEKLIMKESHVTAHDDKLIEMYKRYKILVLGKDLPKSHSSAKIKDNEPVGYITATTVKLYDSSKSKWYYISQSEINVEKRYDENLIIVGFTTPTKNSNIQQTASLKLRPPISKIRKENSIRKGDIRTITRGAACESRHREELISLINQLSKYAKQKNIIVDNLLTNNKLIHNSGEICIDLKKYLLKFEELSRMSKSDVRWLYLFNEIPPSINVILGK